MEEGTKVVKSQNEIHNEWGILQKINKRGGGKYQKTISKTPCLLKR